MPDPILATRDLKCISLIVFIVLYIVKELFLLFCALLFKSEVSLSTSLDAGRHQMTTLECKHMALASNTINAIFIYNTI